MPNTRFLIVCEPRTGSNYLCGMLNSHPQILCHHEVFHPSELYYAYNYRNGPLAHLGTVADRDADPRTFLERLWSERCGNTAVGLKILSGQVPDLLRELLEDRSVRKIVLHRRNRVRSFVSLVRARQSGAWARQRYDHLRVHVDPLELVEHVRRYDEFYARVDAARPGQPWFQIAYEELGTTARIEELLEFLGATPQSSWLKAPNARQSFDTLRTAISNFDELESVLAGTALARELCDEAHESAAA